MDLGSHTASWTTTWAWHLETTPVKLVKQQQH